MRKSKIILLFKLLVFFLLFIGLIRVFIYKLNYRFYKDDSFNEGTVTLVNKKSDYSVINIKSSKKNYKAYINIDNNIDYGDKIYFKYVNKEVYKNTIPNTFNYKKYLKSKKINQVIIITEYRKIRTSWYYKCKGFVYKTLLKRKSKNYILTFLCGDKSQLDNDVKMSFMNNGISHLLCVSGFHVAFLFDYIIVLLRSIFKNKIISMTILILFALFYLILTSFMIALFRAVLMYFFSYIRRRSKYKIKSIYYFILTLAVSLIIFPNVVYDVGFYYTYVLTFFLIIHKNELKNIFKVTIYSFIIAAPITIYLNYNIHFLSVILTIVSSFFVCYILYPLSFIAVVSSTADKVLYKVAYYFELVNLRFDKVNIFKIIIPKTSIYIIIIIYIIYFIYLIFKNKICIYLFLSLMIYLIFNKYFNNYSYVYFVDVRQGDMSVIISKNFKNVTIIDTGGIVEDKYLKNSTKQFLYSIGVKKIDTLILTHGDYDHMGEAINLVKNFRVEKVIFNCGPYNDLEQDLIKVLNKKKIPYYSCIKELNINDNKQYFLQTKEYDNENDNSNVIYTEINGYKFMFMGDVGVEKEKDILDKYNISDVDVLKVGHHGSKTSSSEEFINEINPKYSIISVGKNNRYGHPNKEVLDTLKDSKIYRTDQDGSIMFKIKNNKLKMETCSP
ncbi:MAG: DNA internalization-related competence protein ComEC/Rec2 [Bacilli bacterium]|nr:DNA internalization-related competence protein ComEC/Rec2 [Bacilli bacterium]